ncbi:MAG: 50S ribosomal protein L23 [Clostridiales bacterium]|jgi:large subunit ribosomal protein L23|nr:50S ribosomal protein L23 [Clostridiales bacterium]
MKNPHDIIIKPVLSEKSYDEMPDKRYTFLVDPKANKTEIKKAVEAIFGVKVQSVNTLRQQGKLKRVGVHTGRKPSFKKAYVKLTAESKEIEFFEGMAQ